MENVTGYLLPFEDFKSFQRILRQNVVRTLGGATPEIFFSNNDHPYHITPHTQTILIGEMQNFLQVFISRLKERMIGQQSGLVTNEPGHAHGHAHHAHGRPHGHAHGHTKPQRWYVIIDGKCLIQM